MTPSEAARELDLHPKTITRWAKEGKMPHVRTLGGHRRYRRSTVQRMKPLAAKVRRSKKLYTDD